MIARGTTSSAANERRRIACDHSILQLARDLDTPAEVLGLFGEEIVCSLGELAEERRTHCLSLAAADSGRVPVNYNYGRGAVIVRATQGRDE